MGTTDELVDGDVVGRLRGVLLARAPGPGSGWPALAGAAATVVGLPLRRRVDVVRDAIAVDAWRREGDDAVFEEGLERLRGLTGRLSAEFALRIFLDADVDRALRVVQEWCTDEDEHVRRLAAPDPTTPALVRRALRTLVTAGDGRALAVLGFGGTAAVSGPVLDRTTVRVGRTSRSAGRCGTPARRSPVLRRLRRPLPQGTRAPRPEDLQARDADPRPRPSRRRAPGQRAALRPRLVRPRRVTFTRSPQVARAAPTPVSLVSSA